MTSLALEDTTGRRLSVFPFATLKRVKDYLEWHYPPGPVELTHDAQGQPRFTVAGTTVVVTTYSDLDRRVDSGDTTDEDVLTTLVRP